MLLRFIFFLVILFGILLFARIVLRKIYPTIHHPSETPPATDLIQCAHCGAYFNIQQGVFKKGKTFCSVQHYNAHQG